MLKPVEIHTDGSCLGNPGPGGYAAILRYQNHEKEIRQGCQLTTNNRMELQAVIAALSALKYPCQVTLYSDSKYVVDTINKGRVVNWQARNWDKGKRANADLWQQLLDQCAIHSVEFNWVKAHAGNPDNERCDQLARAAAGEMQPANNQ